MATIIIIGRLTRDPDYTPSQNGKSQRVNFTVAEDNEHGDGASFYDCVAFGKQADVIDKWTHKGKLVAVKGSMEQGDTYTDKNGNKRRSWSVWTERCKFLDSANKKSGDSWEEQERDVPF